MELRLKMPIVFEIRVALKESRRDGVGALLKLALSGPEEGLPLEDFGRMLRADVARSCEFRRAPFLPLGNQAKACRMCMSLLKMSVGIHDRRS